MTFEKDGFKAVSRDYLGREVKASISGFGNTVHINAESNEGKTQFITTEARQQRDGKRKEMPDVKTTKALDICTLSNPDGFA